MANNAFQWEAVGSADTVLSTELNSLGNGSRTAKGTAWDNLAGGSRNKTLVRAKLAVTFGSAPSTGGYVDLHGCTELDGSYDDGDASTDPGAHTHLVSIPVKATTNAQVLHSRPFWVDPLTYKFILTNRSGVAFPSSGSTVKLIPYRGELE